MRRSLIKRTGESLSQLFDAFEQFTSDVLHDRRETPGARAYGFLLSGLSLVFEGIVRARLFLFRKRVLQRNYLGCLVVAVGNLTVGGTGKTPVVEKFARALTAQGRRVAILSRGYKSKREPRWKRLWRVVTHQPEPPPKIVSMGQGPLLTADISGDEPHMLARNLTGVIILVDKNRAAAGRYAVENLGVDTLILDDGFQYLKLPAQINLLLVDKSNPFGNRSLLPRGVLREPVAHLRRATYVFLTRSDGRPDPELISEIRQHKPDVEIIECAHRPRHLRQVNGPAQHPLEWLRGKKIAAFSGIAVPESFERFLTDLGAEIRYVKRFTDHHSFTDREIAKLYRKTAAHGLDIVVTTEKDAVRLAPDFTPPVTTFFLRLEIDILSGASDFDAAVNRLCQPFLTGLAPTPSEDDLEG